MTYYSGTVDNSVKDARFAFIDALQTAMATEGWTVTASDMVDPAYSFTAQSVNTKNAKLSVTVEILNANSINFSMSVDGIASDSMSIIAASLGFDYKINVNSTRICGCAISITQDYQSFYCGYLIPHVIDAHYPNSAVCGAMNNALDLTIPTEGLIPYKGTGKNIQAIKVGGTFEYCTTHPYNSLLPLDSRTQTFLTTVRGPITILDSTLTPMGELDGIYTFICHDPTADIGTFNSDTQGLSLIVCANPNFKTISDVYAMTGE